MKSLRLVLLLILCPNFIQAMDSQSRLHVLLDEVAADTSISREALQARAESIGSAMQQLYNNDELVHKVMGLKPILEGKLRFRVLNFFLRSPKATSVERFNLAAEFIKDSTESKDRIASIISEIVTIIYNDTFAFYPFQEKIIKKLGDEQEKAIRAVLLKMPKFGVLEEYSKVDLKNVALHDLLYALQVCRTIEEHRDCSKKLEDFFEHYIPGISQNLELSPFKKDAKKIDVTKDQYAIIDTLITKIKEIAETFKTLGFPLGSSISKQETFLKIIGGFGNWIGKLAADPLSQGIGLAKQYALLDFVHLEETYRITRSLFKVVDNEPRINELISEIKADTKITRESLQSKAKELATLMQEPFPDAQLLINQIMKMGDILDGKLRFRLIDFFVASKESKLSAVDRLKLAALFLENNSESPARHGAVAAQTAELLYKYSDKFAPYTNEYDVERTLRTNYKDEIKKNLLEKEIYNVIKTHCDIDFTHSSLSLLVYYSQLYKVFLKELHDSQEFETLIQRHRDVVGTRGHITRAHWERAKVLAENILENKEKLLKLGLLSNPLLGSQSNLEKLIGGMRNYYQKNNEIPPQERGANIIKGCTLQYTTSITRENYDRYLALMKTSVRD